MDLGSRVVVLSPHLDDAVFSLGATITRIARSGAQVTVLTVFAGDPSSETEAGWWDRLAGFRTAGEAARLRREEDRRACDLVGATPFWLPFMDSQYAPTIPEAKIWASIVVATAKAETIFVPGFPLQHPDHARLARIVLENEFADARVALYAEQPYGWKRSMKPAPPPLEELVKSPLTWLHLPAGLADRRAKMKASRTYRTQMPLIGRFAPLRIALDELKRGGEAMAWITP